MPLPEQPDGVVDCVPQGLPVELMGGQKITGLVWAGLGLILVAAALFGLLLYVDGLPWQG